MYRTYLHFDPPVELDRFPMPLIMLDFPSPAPQFYWVSEACDSYAKFLFNVDYATIEIMHGGDPVKWWNWLRR